MSRSKVLDLATSTPHQLAQAEAGLPLWPLNTTLPTRAFLHWGRSECNRSDQPRIAGKVGDAPNGRYVGGRLTSTPCLLRHERRGRGGCQGEGGRTVGSKAVVARVTHLTAMSLTAPQRLAAHVLSPQPARLDWGTRHGTPVPPSQQFPHQPLTAPLLPTSSSSLPFPHCTKMVDGTQGVP